MNVNEIREKYIGDVSLVNLSNKEKIQKYYTQENQKKAIDRIKNDTSMNVVTLANEAVRILNEAWRNVVEAKTTLEKGGFSGSAKSVYKLTNNIKKEIDLIRKEESLRRKQVKGTGWSTAGYTNNTK